MSVNPSSSDQFQRDFRRSYEFWRYTMICFALFLILSVVSIYLHRNPEFLMNFWLPHQYVQGAGRICLIAGIVFVILSFLFFSSDMRSPSLGSLCLFVALIFIIGVIYHLATKWFSANSEERDRYARSLKNWIPAFIVLLVIIGVFSDC